MSPLLIGLCAYVGLQLSIGVWVSRRIRGEDDFLLAGRSLGPWLASASIFATWFGAETCVGAAGEVYEHGLSATLSDPFGYGLCLLVFGVCLVVPLYRRRLTTLADLFRQRYSPGVERLVAVMLIPSSLFWASAQIRAFGGLLASGTELDVETGVVIAALVSCTYTVFGGLLADAYTDLIQGAVLVSTLLVLGGVAIAAEGGPAMSVKLIAEAMPQSGGGGPSLVVLDAWAVPVLGSLFAQELLSRAVASRSEHVAKRSTLRAAGAYLLVGMVPVLLGALGRARLPHASPEAVLSEMALHYLGSLGYVLLTGALVSAILSTVDSALLVAAAFVSHNLAPAVAPGLRDRGRLWLARASVVALTLLAFQAARGDSSVHDLVQQASAAGSAGICVAGLFALFTRRGGPAAAYAAILTGAASWSVATYAFASEVAFSSALALAALAYVAAGGLARQAERLPTS